MSPPLARSLPALLSHWWHQLRFRHENKKGWDEVLDEMFLLHIKLTNDIPLFYAAKTNNVACIRKLLSFASTNIFERGALGETALHIAVMNDNVEAAVALMDGAPELINEPMTSELFQGVTPLHIAVENQNIDLVQQLISHGGDVATPRATGLYFRKRRGGHMYTGEHILTFAVCAGNRDIISMVIDAGASTRVQDYLGNTVLHILVLQPNKVAACQSINLIMARDAELQEPVPLDMVPNLRGLTPMKVAAKKGNIMVFEDIVNRRRKLQWSLGCFSSNLYDLTGIDSWADNMSVLELIVRSHHREAMLLLEVTPVKQLLSLKWKLYGQHYFRVLIILYLVYIGIFTACCFYRPLMDIPENYTTPIIGQTIYIQKPLTECYVTHQDKVRLAGEIVSLLGAVVMLLVELPDLLRVGAKRYLGQTALGGPFHVLLISFACLVLLLLVFRVCQVQREDDVMALCLVIGWCNVMFFSRGFKMLGPQSIMIQKIILGDLALFMWQILFMTFGYSCGLWVVYMTQDPSGIPSYANFPFTLFSEAVLGSGIVNMPWDPTVYAPPVVYVMQATFTMNVAILLVNILIAMLTDTEWKVNKQKESLWRVQMLSTILMVERKLTPFLWPRFGVCGLKYGLKDAWYLRLEEKNHRVRYFSSEDEKKNERMDNTNPRKKPVSRIPDPRPRNAEGDTLRGWPLIRHRISDFEMEVRRSKQDKDIKYV
uniref:Uncharacterized protein n=1 Tax=Monopterus albus TaxID=43700 RepID=A0A3Q3KGL5_MONAL